MTYKSCYSWMVSFSWDTVLFFFRFAVPGLTRLFLLVVMWNTTFAVGAWCRAERRPRSVINGHREQVSRFKLGQTAARNSIDLSVSNLQLIKLADWSSNLLVMTNFISSMSLSCELDTLKQFRSCWIPIPNYLGQNYRKEYFMTINVYIDFFLRLKKKHY